MPSLIEEPPLPVKVVSPSKGCIKLAVKGLLGNVFPGVTNGGAGLLSDVLDLLDAWGIWFMTESLVELIGKGM